MNDIKSFISSLGRMLGFRKSETCANGYSAKLRCGSYTFTVRIPKSGRSQYKCGDRDTDSRDWKNRVRKAYSWQEDRNYFEFLRRQQEARTNPTRRVFRHEDGVVYTTGCSPRRDINFLRLIGRLK